MIISGPLIVGSLYFLPVELISMYSEEREMLFFVLVYSYLGHIVLVGTISIHVCLPVSSSFMRKVVWNWDDTSMR